MTVKCLPRNAMNGMSSLLLCVSNNEHTHRRKPGRVSGCSLFWLAVLLISTIVGSKSHFGFVVLRGLFYDCQTMALLSTGTQMRDKFLLFEKHISQLMAFGWNVSWIVENHGSIEMTCLFEEFSKCQPSHRAWTCSLDTSHLSTQFKCSSDENMIEKWRATLPFSSVDVKQKTMSVQKKFPKFLHRRDMPKKNAEILNLWYTT